MLKFLLEHWQALANTAGAIVMFIIGRNTRRINTKEAEFLAYKKKLETYELEFALKTEMLENLKKDYESRYILLESNLKKVETQNIKLLSIIKTQEETLEQYEQKFGSIENN
ncbi:hypothetical protein [uncultured Tenacibaculum sp.]|uniref:hypothetical protein n=1 Tax=uncultured Tenacibaculum sp. TaxID=174713 RepID=UPI00260A59A0|nr:hypothetical protein [uncultured Tenacibaculum sp.]